MVAGKLFKLRLHIAVATRMNPGPISWRDRHRVLTFNTTFWGAGFFVVLVLFGTLCRYTLLYW